MHNKRFVLVVLCAMMLLISAVAVFAQEDIAIGDTVEGELTSGKRAEYRFDASVDDVLVISVDAEDFDAYVYLLDSEGETLVADDDSGEGSNALISGYTVTEDGAYAIQVSSFDDRSSGAFTLSLNTLNSQVIEYGQSITEDSGVPAGLYTFTGSTGDLIVVSLNASGFDTTLELMGPDGYSVGYGNYIDGQRTRIGPTSLTADGTYQLNVRASGKSTLKLENVEPVALTLDEPASVTFTEEDQAFYFSLDNPSNQVIDLIVDSGNTLDTALDVISPYGWSVGTAQDGDGTVDPSLMGQVFSDAGTYYIVLTPQNSNAQLEGEVTLSVGKTILANLDEGPQSITFDYLAGEKVVTFEGHEGETVTLKVSINTSESYVAPTISVAQEGVEFSNVYMNGLSQIAFDVVIPADGEVAVSLQVYSEATVTVELLREAE